MRDVSLSGLALATGGSLLLMACGAALPRVAAPPSVPAMDMGMGMDPGARRPLMVPVAGVLPEQVPDSFYAPRSGGRTHQATDIPAARGTPVLAADDGTVVRMGQNRLGGNMIYAVDPSGQLVYYYAHLDRFDERLQPGRWVSRGETLGYVGTTGNAPSGSPHLHFQLMRRSPGGSIYGGEPIDARPFFAVPGTPRSPGDRL